MSQSVCGGSCKYSEGFSTRGNGSFLSKVLTDDRLHGARHGVRGGLEPTHTGAREPIAKYSGVLPTGCC